MDSSLSSGAGLLHKQLLYEMLYMWAAAGFMDTLLRCEDETGGGLCVAEQAKKPTQSGG